MIHRVGNMWEGREPGEPVFITTNSFVKQNGELVMGRGAAKVARDTIPGFAGRLGAHILRTCGSLGRYGIAFSGADRVGAFQVKYRWSDPADLELISFSVQQLLPFIERHQGVIHLNYPGIGNGQLAVRDVEPLLEALPVCVNVWRFR